jgi:hypothetical protein
MMSIARTARSRLTNRLAQGRLPPAIDGRGTLARRWRDLKLDLLGALGCADAGQLDPARRLLLDRTIGAVIACEQLESRLVEGEQIDLPAYHRLLASSSRGLVNLGLVSTPTPAVGQRNGAGHGRDDAAYRAKVVDVILALARVSPRGAAALDAVIGAAGRNQPQPDDDDEALPLLRDYDSDDDGEGASGDDDDDMPAPKPKPPRNGGRRRRRDRVCQEHE